MEKKSNTKSFVNIIIIATYLDLRDLLNLSQISKEFFSILKLEHLWLNLLHSTNFLGPTIVEKKSENTSFQRYFKHIYASYKEIKKCMFGLCKKFNYEQYFTVKHPNFLVHSKESNHNLLKKIIKNIYGQIPISYFLLYSIMNGQSSLECLSNYNSNPKAFFGGFSYYFDFYEFFFSPLETINCGFLNNLKFHPLAKENHNYYLLVDFGNLLGFGNEAIFSIISKETTPTGTIFTIFIFDTTLCNFLKRLVNCSFDSNPEKLYLDHFDTLNAPPSDITTKGIRIRAQALYNPWDQRVQNKLFFPYQIRISDNGIQKAYKLHSRKWIIRDGENVEKIEGEGVIGEFPIIYPGCEDFIYESVSVVEKFNGEMKGSFFFKACDGSDDFIEAKIGVFRFELGERKKLLKFNLEKKEVSIIT